MIISLPWEEEVNEQKEQERLTITHEEPPPRTNAVSGGVILYGPTDRQRGLR